MTTGMEKIQTTAKLNNLRVAPRKVRLLVDLVRGLKVEQALEQLTVSKKTAARSVMKLLQSAVANALHNHNLRKDSLIIVSAYVNNGATLHRWTPRAMGRATPIRKRTAHITLVLEGEIDEKAVKKAKTEVEKKVKENKKSKIDTDKDKMEMGKKVEEIKGEKV